MSLITLLVITIVVFVVLGVIGGFDLIDFLTNLYVSITKD